MDVKAIEDIIRTMDNSQLGYLEINWQGISIVMKKQGEEGNIKNINIMGENKEKVSVISQNCEDKTIKKDEKINELEVTEGEIATEKDDSIKEITAPIVGTFYSSPSPDKPPFVSVGSKVKKGDVLCIIEAMKLMNEIQSEAEGEVVEILAKNEQMVEYGQLIFKIKDSN